METLFEERLRGLAAHQQGSLTSLLLEWILTLNAEGARQRAKGRWVLQSTAVMISGRPDYPVI